MDTNESNSKSKSAINTVVNTGLKTTNKAGVTDKHPSETKKAKIIDKLNKPLRKVAHATEYFVFTILIIMALRDCGVKGRKVWFITLGICFIYSCTDEFHQTFVNGRTGQFTDCLIDTAGGLVACLCSFLHGRIRRKKEKSHNNVM